MAMATMALLPWKCPIYRGRKSTLQVPNMHRGHMSANVTLLGGGGEGVEQDGRTWQPFVGSKNGNENFRQARIYNFRVKCVVFARNRKFAKLTQ